MKLYKYSQDFGRMGSLEGVFALTDEEYARGIAKGEVYLGEVLGKHSEVTAYIQPSTVTMLTDDAEFVERAVTYGIVPSGTNPFSEIEPD